MYVYIGQKRYSFFLQIESEGQQKKAYFLKDKFDDGKKFDFSRKNTKNYNMTDKYLYTMLVCNEKAYSTDQNGNRSPYSLLRMTDINS